MMFDRITQELEQMVNIFFCCFYQYNFTLILTQDMKEISYRNFENSYRFDSQIKQGGFGRVYRIQNIKTQNWYALKKLIIKKKQHMSDAENEIRILTRYQHPLIVKIFEYYKIQNKSWFGKGAFEFGIILELAKCSLFHMIKHKIQLGDQKTLVRQMISLIRLLCYLQEEGIAHRDIKPDNILIFAQENSEYVWKLADFGLSINTKENKNDESIAGSIEYASPKLKIKFRSRNAKIKTNPFKDDVYSLGITLVEILTRNRNYSPYIHESLKRMCTKKILVDIIDMMLEEEEEKRPCFRELIMILKRDYPQYLQEAIEEQKKKFDFNNPEEVHLKQNLKDKQNYSSRLNEHKTITKRKPYSIKTTKTKSTGKVIQCIASVEGLKMCGCRDGSIVFINEDDLFYVNKVHGSFVSVLAKDHYGDIWSSGADGRVIRWQTNQLGRALINDSKIEEKKVRTIFGKVSDEMSKKRLVFKPSSKVQAVIKVPYTRKGGVSALFPVDDYHYAMGFYDGFVFITWNSMEYFSQIHTSPVTSVKLCLKAGKAITASGDGFIKMIDLKTGTLTHKIYNCRGWIIGMEVIQNGNDVRILAITASGVYYELDGDLTCREETLLPEQTDNILACMFQERNCFVLTQSTLLDANEEIKINLERKGWNCLWSTHERQLLMGSFEGEFVQVEW